MTIGALIWFILFALNAGLFFGIAIVVAFRGTKELRNLLKGGQQNRAGR